MTVYATKQYIGGAESVSPAHGGCGKTHAYETGPEGFPQITCPDGCEEFLRSLYGHAALPRDLPETYDDAQTQRRLREQGTAYRDGLTAAALARMAGLAPDAGALAALMPAGTAVPPVTCAAGHPNAAGARFCTACGTPLGSGPVRCPAGHESPAGARWCGECGQPITAEAPKPPRGPGAAKAGRTRAKSA